MNFKISESRRKGGAWLPLLLGLASCVRPARALSKMRLAHTWGSVDFAFASDAQRRQLEADGTYVQGSAVPFDVDVDPRTGRVFVSMPAMLNGSAVTLATLEEPRRVRSPRLVPYPDWGWHAGARGCDGLTSVFRIHVDRCDRLWVIDSGIVDITATFRPRCPPQLLVFKLRTNKLLVRHRFQILQPSTNALLLTVTTEQLDQQCGNDAYAYVADAVGNALFVYSLRQNRSWRVASTLFEPDERAREFRVAGTTLELTDGVLGLAVSPRVGDRCGSHLFFHALTSFQEGRACTAVLRNASLFAGGAQAPEGALAFIGRRDGQCAAQSSSAAGVLFFSPVNKYSINCWNQGRKYGSPNLPAVEQDPEVIRFVTGLKVIPSAKNRGPEEVWAISNNAQLLFSGAYRPNVPNTVNIVRGSVASLVAGVNC